MAETFQNLLLGFEVVLAPSVLVYAFLAVVAIGSVTALLTRLPLLRDDGRFDSVVSRESGFLLNNVLLIAIAFATYWGTVFPVPPQYANGQVYITPVQPRVFGVRFSQEF